MAGACGIGVFISFVGVKDAGWIVAAPYPTLVSLNLGVPYGFSELPPPARPPACPAHCCADTGLHCYGCSGVLGRKGALHQQHPNAHPRRAAPNADHLPSQRQSPAQSLRGWPVTHCAAHEHAG